MDKLLYLILGLLLLFLIIAVVFFVRMIQYKRQIRIFTEKLEKRFQGDVNQSISVEYFDRDIVKLANVLNEYSDVIREKNIALVNEENKLKGVIAGISHDFRTPLTVARGYLQLIGKNCRNGINDPDMMDDRDKKNCLDEKNLEYLDISISKLDYLKKLSDDFFELSAVEAKSEPVKMEDIDISRILTEITLEQYDWIQEKGIRADFDIPEDIGNVRGNRELTERIFYNLFSNMKKYAKSVVNVSVKKNPDSGELEVLFSNDTEQGCELDENSVFDPFYRGSSRHEEGAGLGLYVVKQLSENMGYDVRCRVTDEKFEVIESINISGIPYNLY